MFRHQDRIQNVPGASATLRSVWDAAYNFHSCTTALGGFVQHVFRLPAQSQGAHFEASVLRRQSKNALYYAALRIMPTSAAKPAWEAVIAVEDAA